MTPRSPQHLPSAMEVDSHHNKRLCIDDDANTAHDLEHARKKQFLGAKVTDSLVTPIHELLRGSQKRGCCIDDAAHNLEHPRKRPKTKGIDGNKLFISFVPSAMQEQAAAATNESEKSVDLTIPIQSTEVISTTSIFGAAKVEDTTSAEATAQGEDTKEVKDITPVESTVTKRNHPKGHITELPNEVFFLIMKEMKPCAAVCLALAVKQAYPVMKELYPHPKDVRLDICVGFKNKNKPSKQLHHLLNDWMGPDRTYQGFTHFYKFYTAEALARREDEKEKNKAKRQRWQDEKKHFKSYRSWAAYDKSRAEGKKGFEMGNRVWYGGGANRKRRPHGWAKKQKALTEGPAAADDGGNGGGDVGGAAANGA